MAGKGLMVIREGSKIRAGPQLAGWQGSIATNFNQESLQ